MNKNTIFGLGIGGGVLLLLFLLFTLSKVTTVQGNQIGVMETWFGGVLPDQLGPRTYWCYPWQTIYKYSIATQVFVMNDVPGDSEPHNGRERDSYLVQSKDSQDMHLSLQVQWRVDPEHVVTLHKTVGVKGVEEVVMRPSLLRIVKDEATVREAIEAYSGDGLVKLQQDIERDLSDPTGELRAKGIIVDSFVIEHIRLDEAYVAEITARQIAIQKEQRATQEEKAAQADALKAKAIAQAALNTAVVKAQSDKEVQVLKAEAENEQEILKAEAEAKKVVLAAQAEKDSGELKAASILALGKANAESEKLKFSAYSAEGADVYARIQVANSLGNSLSGIKGYLPENMNVYTLGESFMKAVENIVKPAK
jgi:regulator of protease activity HflC (stomatin/prohibitin superfamily)